MKKILLSALAFVAFGVSAQVYTCNDAAGFSTWTAYNNDSDTLNWFIADLTGAGTALDSQGECAVSDSWTQNNGALTPDNLLVSPVIDLSSTSGAAALDLSWGCGSNESTTSGFFEEHYACYVVTATELAAIVGTGTYPTPVFEGTLTAGEVMETQTVDISSVAGEAQVYVAYRHYNCTDMNYIVLDDISIDAAFASVEENNFEVSIYPNPAVNELNFSLGTAVESVTIYGLDGKILATEVVNALTGTIDISGIAKGTYICEFKTANGNVSRNTFVKK